MTGVESGPQASVRPAVSIVTPVHNESASLGRLVTEVETALTGVDFELIAVDDGSSDDSAVVLEGLAASRPWLRLVSIHPNLGQTAAMSAGWRRAAGDVIVTIDADCQNDPADIPRLLQMLATTEADVVVGRRTARSASAFRRACSSSANALCRLVAGVPVHDTGCTLKAFRREVLEGMHVYADDHRFLAPLAASRGARVAEVEVADRPRIVGTGHYGIGRSPGVAADLLGLWVTCRFRGRPLRAAGWTATVLLLMWLGLAAVAWAEGSTLDALVLVSSGLTFAAILLVMAASIESRGRSGWRGQ
jgi:glycosyltransferase involved in cell wall biosynthesis